MGLANLGGITFRINPNEIAWNWQINTNVIETIGGRVVQIYGATLSDITVTGSFGEQRIAGQGGDDSPGRGWRMADAFAKQIHDLMAAQAPLPGGSKGYQAPKPVRFTYMTQGDPLGHGFHDYDFMVYVRSLEDVSGQGVVFHQTGKFAYEYRLTLVPVVDNTTHLMDSFGPPQQSKQAAIEEALNRISNGIGWRLTRFNDGSLASGNQDGLGNITKPVDFAADLRAAILKQGGLTGITPPSGATTGSSGGTGTSGAPVIAKGSVAAPLTGNVLYSQAFGWPSGHPGIDLAQPEGSPIFAVADGVVVAAGPNSGGFGQWIVIKHPALKVDSLYGHMPDNGGVLVNVGDTVKAGQQIGIVDSNGESTGNHLHLEIWTGGNGLADSQNKIDGAAWLAGQGIVIPALGTSGPIKVQS